MRIDRKYSKKRNGEVAGDVFQMGKDFNALNLAMTVLLFFIFSVHSWGVPNAFSQASLAACTYTLTPPSFSCNWQGYGASFAVNTQSGCSWTAVSNASWITLGSRKSGTGNGYADFTILANDSPNERIGTITVGDQTWTVTEGGKPSCAYTLTPTSKAIDSKGSNGSFRVTTKSGCSWTVSSNVSWITITSGSSGSGNGTVKYSVSANASTNSRTGTIGVGNQTFTITQSGAPVPPSIGYSPTTFSFTATQGGANPPSQTLSIGKAGGGSGSLSWKVNSNAQWLRLSPTSGSSSGETDRVTVSVDISHLNVLRYDATITITGQGATNSPITIPVTLTVNPAAQLTIGYSPSSFHFSATKGGANPQSQSLSIGRPGGSSKALGWRISSNAQWLRLSPTSGSSSGETDRVTVSVDISHLNILQYDATITITAQGATNSPVAIPVYLAVNNPQTAQTAKSDSDARLNDAESLFQPTSDGGYIEARETDSSGPDGIDVSVSKFDIRGNLEWEKIYGGSGDDWISSIQEVSDGGYIVVGETDAFGVGQLCIWILKLDTNGNIQWQKAYDGHGHYLVYPIQ
jgi:hypothetical protein